MKKDKICRKSCWISKGFIVLNKNRSTLKNEGQSHTPVLLLKFGEEAHLKELLKNGVLYFSSIEELRKIEKDDREEANYRNDALEGAHACRTIGAGTASTALPDGTPVSFQFLDMFYYEYPEEIFGNICSFYSITTNDFSGNELLPVDERMISFGSHFIFIKNVEEFIRRVAGALEQLKIKWKCRGVEYFNEKQFDGEIGLFKKRSGYAFQKEFRILLFSENKSSFKLNIGNMEDIALTAPSHTIGALKNNNDGKTTGLTMRSAEIRSLPASARFSGSSVLFV
jgi:hypothetical protein